mmetsp:Transcript_60994/g.181626  ORF Transcript_60994/g.181626 Transcript_60994/m.181626 type:complete len:220 (+) Transcript_60994:849-1508(+)
MEAHGRRAAEKAASSSSEREMSGRRSESELSTEACSSGIFCSGMMSSSCETVPRADVSACGSPAAKPAMNSSASSRPSPSASRRLTTSWTTGTATCTPSHRRAEKSSEHVIEPVRDELKAWKACRSERPRERSRRCVAASSARCSKSGNSLCSLRMGATPVRSHGDWTRRRHARSSAKNACRSLGSDVCRQRMRRCCARAVYSVSDEMKRKHSRTTSRS